VNKTEFLEAMEILSGFYGKEPPKRQMEGWYWKLRHLDAEDERSAADEATSHMREFPTPAKFLEFADQCRARRAHNRNCEDARQAKNFLTPEKHTPGVGRDYCAAILEMLDQPNTLEGCQRKFAIVSDILKKHPHHQSELKPLLREIGEKMDGFAQQEAV
jgi:hypothetical protein